MTLSKRGDYVVRSALCLARAAADGGSRKIREVVAEMDVPQTFASQILADLVRANLAVSKAGKDGGYRLARAPSEISLLEVVEAGEGKLHAERCALGDGPCRWEMVCPLHETWTAATAALREVLAETTLEEVLQRDQALELGRGVIPVDSHRAGTALVPARKVSDSVQVERVQSDVLQLLGHEATLADAVVRAYDEAEKLRFELAATTPSFEGTERKSHPAISIGLPERPQKLRDDEAGIANTRRFAWDVTHPSGSSSRLEGTLSVFAVDSERSDLRLEGRFRPSASMSGIHRDDRSIVDRLARAVVRSFLRQLAASIEREPNPTRV